MTKPKREHCHWCGDELAEGNRRGSQRRFCHAACRKMYHAAVRQLGTVVTAEQFGDPGELQEWLGKRVRFVEWRRRAEMARASSRPK